MESRAYNREVSKRKALRKKRICQEVYHFEWYDNLHQYSKNKVHCSCPICSAKTRNKGHKRFHYGNYNRSINYGRSDLRKQINMDDQIQELTGRKIHRSAKYW